MHQVMEKSRGLIADHLVMVNILELTMVMVTFYMRINGYNVRRGQKVKRGDVIGFVGSTDVLKPLTYTMKLLKTEEKSIPLIFITVI